MTSTQVRTAQARTVGFPRPRRSRTTRNGVLIALGIAVLVVLAAVVLARDIGAEPAAPPTPVLSAPPPAYLPGGSVYESQVPRDG